MTEEQEFLRMDLEGLSETDILVILAVDGEAPLSKTRLQNMLLMYRRTYGPERGDPDYVTNPFAGFSDDVNESAIHLIAIGVLDDLWNGLGLTGYGVTFRRSVLEICKDRPYAVRVDNIRKAVSDIAPRTLVFVTHRFYRDIMDFSPAKSLMPACIKETRLDGIPLEDYDERRFRDNLRDGVRMTVG
ncbi:MAG: hypothetical protein MJZ68_08705 [archaeon]|nr:hypothetical protein [archaeon]